MAADRLCQCASDASDGVHLAAMEDVCRQDRPEIGAGNGVLDDAHGFARAWLLAF